MKNSLHDAMCVFSIIMKNPLLILYSLLTKCEIMTGIPLGIENDLEDSQFYNRVEEVSFLSDNLKLTKKGSTPTILLTGIKGVGKSALLKKLKKRFSR